MKNSPLAAVNSDFKWFVAAASRPDALYLFAAFLPPQQPFSNYKYLVPVDTWTSLKTSPTQCNGIDHSASATTAMGQVYLIGGLQTRR